MHPTLPFPFATKFAIDQIAFAGFQNAKISPHKCKTKQRTYRPIFQDGPPTIGENLFKFRRHSLLYLVKARVKLLKPFVRLLIIYAGLNAVNIKLYSDG